MRILIEVKDGANGFRVIAEIGRTVRQHSGWQSVRYNGRRGPSTATAGQKFLRPFVAGTVHVQVFGELIATNH